MNNQAENNIEYADKKTPFTEENDSRRVGTVTMALSLIGVGVLILINTLGAGLKLETIARLAPAIMILLGTEILIRYFLAKGKKLKYDFLSGFVCFCLIVGSFVLAAIPAAFEHFGPKRDWLEQSLQQECTQKVAAALEEDDLTHIYCQVSLYRRDLPDELHAEELQVTDYVGLNVQLANRFANRDAFAEYAWQMLDRSLSTGIPFDYVNIDTPSGDGLDGFYLHLDGSVGFPKDREAILAQLETYNSVEVSSDYSMAAEFADKHIDVFKQFVDAREGVMPEEYILRCRAFAACYEEYYHCFINGEEYGDLPIDELTASAAESVSDLPSPDQT